MCGSRLLVSAWCWMTDRGRERDPPPEQEAAARTTVNTEETPNNVDISGRRDIPPIPECRAKQGCDSRVSKSRWGGHSGENKAQRALSSQVDHEGAAGLRYALLGGLPVPQRAHRAAAHEGGIPETQAGGLHQPLQEGHAGTLRLCQRHWVLQQRRRMARVR